MRKHIKTLSAFLVLLALVLVPLTADAFKLGKVLGDAVKSSTKQQVTGDAEKSSRQEEVDRHMESLYAKRSDKVDVRTYHIWQHTSPRPAQYASKFGDPYVGEVMIFVIQEGSVSKDPNDESVDIARGHKIISQQTIMSGPGNNTIQVSVPDMPYISIHYWAKAVGSGPGGSRREFFEGKDLGYNLIITKERGTPYRTIHQTIKVESKN